MCVDVEYNTATHVSDDIPNKAKALLHSKALQSSTCKAMERKLPIPLVTT